MILSHLAKITSGISYGLVIKSAAPSLIERTSASFSDVITMIGIRRSDSSSLRFLISSKPSIIGIRRSTSIKEKLQSPALRISSASLPFSAAWTSYSELKILDKISLLIISSSTTRTCLFRPLNPLKIFIYPILLLY